MTNIVSDVASEAHKTKEESGLRPLFPAFIHISLGVIAVVAILLWLWTASAIRGWSFRLPITLAAIAFLTFYVAGELVRWRLRLSLRNMFFSVTLLAIACSGFGAWLLDTVQQKNRVQAIQQLGGYVSYDSYDTVTGLDGKFVTSEGWIVPQRLVDDLGVDVFARTKEVGWFYGGINDSELSTLDLQGFTSVAVCSPEITDAGLEYVCQNPEVTKLWLGSTKITNEGLRAIENLPQLHYLNLFNTGISDECLTHIRSSSGLRFVNLKKTQFTQDGLEELRRMLPDCQVLSDFDE